MLNLVKIISTKLESATRRVKFLRYGKSDVQEMRVVQPFGIDGAPRKDMVALYAATGENGKAVVVGYINKNQIADVGELHLYATESDSDTKVGYIHLKNDGQIHINGTGDNLVRFTALENEINTLKTELNQLRDFYNAHTHLGNSGFPTSTPSNGWAGTSIDISGAKIDELEVDP